MRDRVKPGSSIRVSPTEPQRRNDDCDERDDLADAACAGTSSADGHGGRSVLSYLCKAGRADGKRTTNADPKNDSSTPQARTAVVGAGLRNSVPPGALVHNLPTLLLRAYRRIAYHYDVGNELHRLMLYATKGEAGFRTRSLRDAQPVLA
jgi:hypothetical protein